MSGLGEDGKLRPTGHERKQYQGVTTTYVVLACIVAASGGGLFGYDNVESTLAGSHSDLLSSSLCSILHHQELVTTFCGG